jgi:hypothetical protein
MPCCTRRRRLQRFASLAWLALLLASFLLDPGASSSASSRSSLPSPLGLSRTVPRLLVSVAAHHSEGKTTAHLERVLREYCVRYAEEISVEVVVDTNSALLAEAVGRFEGLPPRCVRTQVWALEELGNALHLPWVHRHMWQVRAGEADFFLFSEDDVLLPLPAFQLYAERQCALWRRGWLFGWVRAEVWGGDNETAISIDNIVPVQDPPVYETPEGHAYAEPWSPYTAFYVLSAEQLAALLRDADEGDVWHGGFPPFLPREKVSVGWGYTRLGGASEPYGAKGWRARVLVPMDEKRRQPHPSAVAWHLPRKYAASPRLFFQDLGAVPVRDMWNFSRPVAAQPLPELQQMATV